MKCEIIKDLLPLYIDDVVSDETRRAVEEHIINCKECNLVYERLNEKIELEIPVSEEEEYSKKLFKRIRIKYIWTILACLIIGMWITCIGFMLYPSANPWLKTYFNIDSHYELKSENAADVFSEIKGYVELITETDLLVINDLGGYFDEEGYISEYAEYIVMKLCEDRRGVVPVYECVYDVKTNNLHIYKYYKMQIRIQGIKDSCWHDMKDKLVLSEYEFGASKIIEVKKENNEIVLKGMLVENDNEFISSGYSYQIK